MASLSDYLESGLLQHIFRSGEFPKPSGMAVCLTSAAPLDSDTGETMLEIPSGINGSGTGYSRIDLGTPTESGNQKWAHTAERILEGSGVIGNSGAFIWDTALVDWGWVSGIALCDTANYASGNLLMHAQLDNPRIIYTGDSVKFDADALQISFD